MTAHAERAAMSEEEYRAYPVPSFSSLKNFITATPAHFLHKIKSTPAMQKGTAKHMAILEPEEFSKMYEINTFTNKSGKVCFSTSEAKAYRDARALEGVTVLNPSDYEEIASSASIAYNHPHAAKLLRESQKEVKMFFEIDGVNMKGMTDSLKVVDDGFAKTLYVCDVKCLPDASDYGCNKRFNDWFYQMPMQLATYVEGAKKMYPNITRVSCWVIFIEAKTSFVNVKPVPPEMLEKGMIALKVALKRYKECMKLDHFPAYISSKELEINEWNNERYNELRLELI